MNAILLTAVLLGQCTPQSTLGAGFPLEVDIYLEQTTESAPPYYLKGTGYVQLQMASGNTKTESVAIEELQGFDVWAPAFALKKLRQDPNNPSPHVLSMGGRQAYYNCKSF